MKLEYDFRVVGAQMLESRLKTVKADADEIVKPMLDELLRLVRSSASHAEIEKSLVLFGAGTEDDAHLAADLIPDPFT